MLIISQEIDSPPEVSNEFPESGDGGPVLEAVERELFSIVPSARKLWLLFPHGIGDETAEIEPRPALLPTLLPGECCSN